MNYNFNYNNEKLYITQSTGNCYYGICLDFSCIDKKDIQELIDYLKERKGENE